MAASIEIATGIQTLVPEVLWRDPHSVREPELAAYIGALERACRDHPDRSDFHACLGVAYAMNFEPYKSMDALQAAVRIAPDDFLAQLKYSELMYRLRALDLAEEETLKAVHLAQNAWQVSLARKQLLEVRRLRREGTQKPAWIKPLGPPAAALLFLLVAVCITAALR